MSPSPAAERLIGPSNDRAAAETDVLVAGAGAAGLIAAVALARAGLSVFCAGPTETVPNGRTVALFEGSLRLLKALDLWPALCADAAPLERITMIDATGARLPIPSVTFAAREIGLPAFGSNIENHRLVATLAAIAQETPGLTHDPHLIADIQPRTDGVTAVLENGRTMTARLVVAADGRRSTARAMARIGTRSWTYPQVALTATLAHKKPHRGTSVEFHTRGGPCTLVPLRGREAPHRSSLVWLMSAAEALRRRALPDTTLARELERQVASIYGPMELEPGRGFFPMGGMRVARLAGHRTVLIGEAAHVFPPLAAQGLNLSLRDIAALVDCLEDARRSGEDIGARAVLADYAAARRSDISLRTSGVDILNRSLLTEFAAVDLLRGAGLLAFAAIGPLRRAIMREGVLPFGATPRLMRRTTPERRPARNA